MPVPATLPGKSVLLVPLPRAASHQITTGRHVDEQIRWSKLPPRKPALPRPLPAFCPPSSALSRPSPEGEIRIDARRVQHLQSAKGALPAPAENPKTGATLKIPATTVPPKFSAGTAFKGRCRRQKSGAKK